MTDLSKYNWWQRQAHLRKRRSLYTTGDGRLARFMQEGIIRPAKAWSRHHEEVATGRELRACLRAGFQSWPGLYPVTFITADGEVVCPHCVIKDFKRCISDIRGNMHDRIVRLVCAADMDPSPGYECRDCGETMWEPDEFPTTETD